MVDSSPDYNARAAVEDSAAIIARWQEQGRIARERLQARGQARCDLAFGPSAAERIDLYLPMAGHQSADHTPNAGAGSEQAHTAQPESAGVMASLPLLIFIHGGYWRALDKQDFAWLADAWLDRGWAVAIPNYGLAPVYSIGEQIEQMQRALQFLHQSAAGLGIDPQRMVLAGHSAGGHLGAMLLRSKYAPLAAAILLSGLYDLEPIQHAQFLQADLALTPERVVAWSPLAQVPAPTAAVFAAVGGAEPAGFLVQQESLQRTWSGAPLEAEVWPGLHHFDVCEALAHLEMGPGARLWSWLQRLKV